MKINSREQQQLNAIGQKYDLKLLLLHGSYATGKQHAGSDLDVAFLGKQPLEFSRELELFGEAAKILGNNQERELDLKSLHRTDPLFLHEVARDSQLLYGSEDDYLDFRLHAQMLYDDTQDLRELEYLQTKKLLARLKAQYA